MTPAAEEPRAPRWRRLVFSLLVALISVLVVEVFARVFLPPRWIVAPHPQEDALVTLHPVRGYALRPGLVRRWDHDDGDFDVEIALNSTGQRDGELADARRARVRILAVGDSYTFGIGVEDDQRWSERLERELLRCLPGAPAATVYNAGVPGYSAAQIRQTVEALVPPLDPQIVVVGVYADSYWRVATPYVLHGGSLIISSRAAYVDVRPDGALVTSAFEPGWLRDLDLLLKRTLYAGAHLLSLPNGGRHWPRTRRKLDEASVHAEYEPALQQLAALDDALRERGVSLVLMAINGQRANGSFRALESFYNTILTEFAERREIALVDPLPALERAAAGRPVHRFPNDAHWSPAAHEVAARELLAGLRDVGLVPPCNRTSGAAG